MSVVLTGDVHHAFGGSDQPFADRSEAALAVEFARIAGRHGLKVTLFFTGRAVVDDGDDARALLAMEHVEIGGHGWDAFTPRRWYGLLRRTFGSLHGPAWLQRWMLRRTCATIERWSGRPVRSWRNHAYRYDRHTAGLLAATGVQVWSDDVDLQRLGPYRDPSGVVVLPINTLPDHEHLRHGVCGGAATHGPDEWLTQVCAQVDRTVAAGGVATVLAHPLCMKVVDDWATFERLCALLSGYPTLLAHEAAALPR